MNLRIAVIGAGSFGTTLANLLAHKCHSMLFHGKSPQEAFRDLLSRPPRQESP